MMDTTTIRRTPARDPASCRFLVAVVENSVAASYSADGPVAVESGSGRSAIAVARTTYDLLPGWGWRAIFSRACHLVNAVPGSVLHAFGYLDRQRGTRADSDL